MGMFDDLLGGDAKKKEQDEMRENIDKIREKVQEGRAPAEPSDDSDVRPPSPPVRPDDIQEKERGRPPREGRPSMDRPPERDTSDGTGREEPPSPPESRTREPRQQGGGPDPEPQGPTRDDVPEPPELKDLDVPDIEKGPLFITVDKFRDALQAIADMRRVAADMEDYVGSMEGTLQEDRETEDGVRRILDEAEADTEKLKDIVSP